MTSRDAIRGVILISGIPDSSIDKALLDAGINPESTYSPTQKDAINAASLSVLMSVRGLNSISEGGFSISLDKQGIESRITFLSNGEDAKPTIRNASNKW